MHCTSITTVLQRCFSADFNVAPANVLNPRESALQIYFQDDDDDDDDIVNDDVSDVLPVQGLLSVASFSFDNKSYVIAS